MLILLMLLKWRFSLSLLVGQVSRFPWLSLTVILDSGQTCTASTRVYVERARQRDSESCWLMVLGSSSQVPRRRTLPTWALKQTQHKPPALLDFWRWGRKMAKCSWVACLPMILVPISFNLQLPPGCRTTATSTNWKSSVQYLFSMSSSAKRRSSQGPTTLSVSVLVLL